MARFLSIYERPRLLRIHSVGHLPIEGLTQDKDSAILHCRRRMLCRNLVGWALVVWDTNISSISMWMESEMVLMCSWEVGLVS